MSITELSTDVTPRPLKKEKKRKKSVALSGEPEVLLSGYQRRKAPSSKTRRYSHFSERYKSHRHVKRILSEKHFSFSSNASDKNVHQRWKLFYLWAKNFNMKNNRWRILQVYPIIKGWKAEREKGRQITTGDFRPVWHHWCRWWILRDVSQSTWRELFRSPPFRFHERRRLHNDR